MKTSIKNSFFCFFFALLSPGLFAQVQGTKAGSLPVFPSKLSAFNHVIKNYHIPINFKFGFEKRLDGIYLIEQHFDEGKLENGKKEKLWDRSTQSYVPLRQTLSVNIDSTDVAKRTARISFLKPIALRDKENFDYQEFHGYDSAYIDALNYYSQFKFSDLTDKQLELFARTYRWRSFCYSGDVTNTCQEACEQNGNRDNPMDSVCLRTFLDLNRQGIAIMKALHKRNPEYQTYKFGSIENFISVRYFDLYIDLMSFGKEQEALQALNEIRYDPQLLDSVRTLLKSLPRKAVVFTESENDTYPLMYVQLTQNLRKDVSVINTSLLILAWYNRTFVKRYYGVYTSLPDPFFFLPRGDETLDFASLYDIVKNAKPGKDDPATLTKYNAIQIGKLKVAINSNRYFYKGLHLMLYIIAEQEQKTYFTYKYDYMGIPIKLRKNGLFNVKKQSP
ncbi:MAG: hypothetical protein AB8F95_19315 [Bacteroidia bacterium]